MSAAIPDSLVITSKLLTRAQQEKLTPDEVILNLKEGNKDFVEDKSTFRNNSKKVREAASGQYPKAVILSCLDPRVPVEDIFHAGIADLISIRIAGNIINEDILGSLEYACKVSGTKVIVILGHENCGTIKSAIDDVKFGNITNLLAKIQPAVRSAATDFIGETTSKNTTFIEAVCKANVRLSIKDLRLQSTALADMEQEGRIKIIGAVYDIKSGVVAFL
ncbi:MAG: carbonic anhydrase [Sphingobacteriales bacterium]|nr:MAG: carbonic anhydrase [Sphingobacteriales bacterium]